jgi:hypothetical protein
MVISQEEFDTWLENPVTKAVKRGLALAVQADKNQWAAGQFLHEGSNATMISNARAVGRVEGLQVVINLDHQLLQDMEKDDGE